MQTRATTRSEPTDTETHTPEKRSLHASKDINDTENHYLRRTMMTTPASAGYTRVLSDGDVAAVLRDIAARLAPTEPEKVRIAALNSMIRVADATPRIAAAIASSPDFETALRLSADDSVQLRALLPIALSTFLCTTVPQGGDVPEGFLDAAQQNTHRIITGWLADAAATLKQRQIAADAQQLPVYERARAEADLVCKVHRIQANALLALTAVFTSSIPLAERFLSDDQFCKDLCKLATGFNIGDLIATAARESGIADDVAELLVQDEALIESRTQLDLALLECFSASVNHSRKMQKEVLESDALHLLMHYAKEPANVTTSNGGNKRVNNKKTTKPKPVTAILNDTENNEKSNRVRRMKNLAAVVLIKCSSIAKQLNMPELLPFDTLSDVFIESIIIGAKGLKKNVSTSVPAGAPRKPSALTSDVFTSDLNVTNGVTGAVEGLAYLSTRNKVKEIIAKNSELLKALALFLGPESDKLLYFGVCSILQNVVMYRKIKSEEEKMRKKLADMASGQSTTVKEGQKITKEGDDEEKDPLMEDTKVERRGRAVVDAGLVAALTSCLASAQASGCRTSRLNSAVCHILLNLARENHNRGIIAQQGGMKVLFEMLENELPRAQGGCATDATVALARLSIGLDPTIAFTQARLLGLIKPFTDLLKGENLLEQFEALMALTNFASMQEAYVFTKMRACKVMEQVENLMFSENVMVRRAATELVCNMVFDPEVFTSYASRKPEAHRLQLLVALSDSEDFATRRAASGALAILSDHPLACLSISLEQRGCEISVGLVTLDEDTNVEIHARGLALIGNMLRAYSTYKSEHETNKNAIAKPSDIAKEDDDDKIFSDSRFGDIYKKLVDCGLLAALTQLTAQSPSPDIRGGAKELLASCKSF